MGRPRCEIYELSLHVNSFLPLFFTMTKQFALPFLLLACGLRLVLGQRLTGSTNSRQLVQGGPVVRNHQYQVLHSFYLGTRMNREASRVKHDWFVSGFSDPQIDDYCTWAGVTCDVQGFVVALDLSEKGLVGTIPNLQDLSRLRRFRADNNALYGQVPQSLFAIPSLDSVFLGRNYLNGSLPDFSQSTNLKRLSLGSNVLTGTITPTICDMVQLKTLDLTKNTKLHGTLPDCLASLNLTRLRISDIGLVGTIPEGLCGVREMNGLQPNEYGCDAIGCGPGFFQSAGGRQRDNETECEICHVPSNVIGGSRCRWKQLTDEPTPSPLSQAPSPNPTMQPSAMALAVGSAKPSDLPSKAQHSPTGAPSSSPTGTTPPNSNSVSGVVEENVDQINVGRNGSIVAGAVVAVLLGIAALLFVRYRRYRKETGEEDTLDLESRSITNHGGPSVMDFQSIFNSESASPSTVPRTRSILRRPTIQSRTRSLRKVRFDIPIPEARSYESVNEDTSLPNDGTPQGGAVADGHKRLNVERYAGNTSVWDSWFANPIFDPNSLCSTPPCTPSKSGAGDVKSGSSRHTSPNSSSAAPYPSLADSSDNSADPDIDDAPPPTGQKTQILQAQDSLMIARNPSDEDEIMKPFDRITIVQDEGAQTQELRREYGLGPKVSYDPRVASPENIEEGLGLVEI